MLNKIIFIIIAIFSNQIDGALLIHPQFGTVGITKDRKGLLINANQDGCNMHEELLLMAKKTIRLDKRRFEYIAYRTRGWDPTNLPRDLPLEPRDISGWETRYKLKTKK